MLRFPERQSFERVRWRDLCRVKRPAAVAAVAVITGAAGELFKLTDLAEWLGRKLENIPDQLGPIRDWLFLNHPGIAIAIFCGLLTYQYAGKKPLSSVLDWMFPDPPMFARFDIEKPGLTDVL